MLNLKKLVYFHVFIFSIFHTVQVLGTPLVLQGIHHPQLVSTLQATRMIGQLKTENMTGVNDKLWLFLKARENQGWFHL